MSAGLGNMRKGNFAVAAEAFADAERLYVERLGPSHPRVAEAVAYRAWCYAKSNRLEDAIPLFERAIQLELKREDVAGERLRQLIQQLAWARDQLAEG
jgi:tetratricopeptide (TPR) repeat protein